MATEIDTEPETLPPIRQLSFEETMADFDHEARTHLGMSGDELLRRMNAGEFDDIADDPFNHPHLTDLAIWASFLGLIER